MIIQSATTMTPYEHVYLFYEVVGTSQMAITAFISLVSAFLAASYFAAHRLDRFTAILALIIYSMFCLGLINEAFSAARDFTNLGETIWQINQQPGVNLDWFGPAQGETMPNMGPIAISILIMTILAYLGSIWFALRMRRVNKAGDREA